jgi:lysophospholipase L1-like esterase
MITSRRPILRLARVLSLALLLPTLSAVAAPTTIMPLGDSITKGVRDPAPSFAGYRARLFERLRSAGIPFQFVGATTGSSNPAMVAAGEQWHNGYGTFRVDEIHANLDGVQTCRSGDNNCGGYWLTGGHGTGRGEVYPDIVLIMAGTNDIHQDTPVTTICSRMTALLDWFAVHRPRTKVIIAQIVPYDDVSNKSHGRNDAVKAFNRWLRDTIPAKYPRATLVDMYAPFVDASGNLKHASNAPDAIYLSDGIHPSHGGYIAMGDIWFEAVRKAMGR